MFLINVLRCQSETIRTILFGLHRGYIHCFALPFDKIYRIRVYSGTESDARNRLNQSDLSSGKSIFARETIRQQA